MKNVENLQNSAVEKQHVKEINDQFLNSSATLSNRISLGLVADQGHVNSSVEIIN